MTSSTSLYLLNSNKANQLSELLLTWSRDGHGNKQNLLGDNSLVEPPDPIPNSVVKRCIADGSVGFPHVRVGHRQD